MDTDAPVEEAPSASVRVDNLVEAERLGAGESLSMAIPSIGDYLKIPGVAKTTTVVVEEEAPDGTRKKFRKTVMSAPRPRRAKAAATKDQPAIDPELQSIWQALPKNVEFLCSFYDDSVTKNYYRGEFKESRQELIQRLLDPELSLEETSRLLGVCPATVRRYTNRGWLAHHRTGGGQRRFRLSDIVKFVDLHGRFPQE
ncbi:MAG: helix-turn-helix domain-containing protein [Fimbriimonas sp.]